MLGPDSHGSLVGRTLGRFHVRRQIGAGGMGVVYEALNDEGDLRLALKTLNHLEPEAIYRLKNEFRGLAGVLHPNLVKMHELSCVGGLWFFVMDYVDGVPFVDYVRGDRPAVSAEPTTVNERRLAGESGTRAAARRHADGQPEGPDDVMYTRLRQALAQLAAGVGALHSMGKIHRDLKPSNVLVTPEGNVLILDFGLTTDDQPVPEQSIQRGLVGTPAYMAPEMFTGEWAGPATDWYAVGVMLYEALVGLLPQRGAARELVSLKLFGEPDAPKSLVPATPDDLNDLCLRLLNRDPAVRPKGPELEALIPVESRAPESRHSELRPGRAQFVGRREELSVLRIALERVGAGKSVVVGVSGESGIGKSALIDAFLDEIRSDRDVAVFNGRCYQRESVPYKAFDQIADALSQYLNRCGDTEAALVMPRDPAALTTLFPVLARVPVIQAPAGRPLPVDPMELRSRGFAAFAELLRRIADRRRLVLAIDDLHWSDADSALLLKDVFGDRDAPACLLLTTSRQARPEALRALLAGATDGEPSALELIELQLSGLSDDEVLELARSAGVADAEPREAVLAIGAEARGNPFFVSALVRNASQAPQGASLASFMRGWLAALPEPALRILQIMAVAGRPVDESVVAAAAGSAEIGGDLSALAAQHFIGAWPTPSRQLECYHDQIREATLAVLSDDELRATHRRLAHALEARTDTDPQQLAVHFLAAGEALRGSPYAERAGDQASQALAFLDAARWYERALVPGDPDGERPRRLRIKLGEAFAGAGRGAEAARWLLEAARDAPVDIGLQLHQRAAELLLASGHIDEGVRGLKDVLAHVHMRLPPTPQRSLLSLLWQRARLWARGLRFVERAADALSQAELLKIDACWTVALGLSLVDPVRAADFQTRNLLFSLRSGEPYRVARALAMEAGFRAVGGSRTEAEAKRLSEQAMRLAERVGNAHAIGLATLTAGLGQYLLGNWGACRDLLERAERVLADQPGAIWELNTAQRFWLNSVAFIGDIPEIANRVPELIRRARERGNLYVECNLRVRQVLLWIARDDPRSAIAETTEAMQRWSQEGFHLQHYNELFALANCALYQGRASEAMHRMRETWPKLRSSLLMRNQAVRIEATHLRTRTCLAYLRHVGRDPSVQAMLDRDIRDLRSQRIPWADALATFASAQRAALRGQVDDARTGLELARKQLAECEMHLLATTTSWRLGQLVGGDSGKELIAGARAWLLAHQVRSPERFVEHYAPGF